ncbi:MAG: DUF938 domain-containing protein [Comamonadaceae bacterium]|nr:DUF938 domain-containing protein [Comamonadaceae bacterium]
MQQITPDFSAAADNNKQPILAVLRQVLGASGRALEIASGTGQHVSFFASHMPHWHWQPTDGNPLSLPSIAAYTAQQNLRNVAQPVLLDVLAPCWLPADASTGETPQFDAIYCANMLHIAPWACSTALMQGAARHLTPEGCLITYGPYLEDDVPTAPGNLAFDQSLRARNPDWGVRRREDLEQMAALVGLKLAERHSMPVNNLLLVWRRLA